MLVRIFSLLFGLLLSVVLIETVLRVLPNEGSTVISDRPKFYYTSKNATLFRDYPESYPSLSEPRIAVVGDSFTFATSMQFDDAFPNKLERLLQATHSPNAQVINYGVPGYSTTHERAAVVSAASDGAQIIVLQITLNDPQIKGYRPSGLIGENEFGPLEMVGVEKILADSFKSYRFVRNRIHNTKTHERYIQYYYDLFYEKKSWNSFKDAIGSIARFAKRENIKLGAVVFPLFGVALDKNYPFVKIHGRVNNLLQRKAVPTLDLFDTFKGLPLEALQVEPGIDFHPNEFGHRLAAEAIFEWLTSNKEFAGFFENE